MLILYLLAEDDIGPFNLRWGGQILVEQRPVVVFRVAVRVFLLPGEVRVAVALLELPGQPQPEPRAGKDSHGKVNGLLILHNGSVL